MVFVNHLPLVYKTVLGTYDYVVEHSFCIDKSIIGTEKHLMCRKGTYLWVDEPQSYAWHLCGKDSLEYKLCLDSLARLNGLNIDVMPPQKHVNAMMTVMSGSGAYPPPWINVLPKQEHKTFTRTLIKNANDILSTSSKDYYKSVWIPGTRVLRSLKRAKINVERYKQLIDSNVGNITAVKTFKPQAGGYAESIEYNRFGTKTGRLSVSSGPSILTLKRDYRNVIESRFGDNGMIVSLDFAALEPRILLYEAGKRCDDPDLYTMLNNELFGGAGERSIVKGAVISELYGIGKNVLQKKLDRPIEVINEFVKKIKAHFETKMLLKRIKEKFLQDGFIENRYGRRVIIEEPLNHIFVNAYAQSTGADVAMLGFDQIIQRCEGRKVVPLFLLVDALILDVHKDDIPFLKTIRNVKVSGYVQSFPITFSHVT